MDDWIQRYLDYKFPIIPLGARSKAPVARGWQENSFPAGAFHNRNVGTRAGEWVNVDGKEGFLAIIDFDLADVELLRRLCTDVPLPRTTCVRSGGQHRGYHLFYLTEFETRKRGMLAYREASIDLLGKGSFAVVPPSVVEAPYRYLLGLEELAFLPTATYEALVSTLTIWKRINMLVKHVVGQKITAEKARESLDDEKLTPDMIAYFRSSLPETET